MNDLSRRQKWLPVACLVFALALAIGGFAVQSIDPPEPGMDLHRARVEGRDDYRAVLEDDLERRQWARKALIAGLYGGAIAFTVAAFWSMNPARPGR